MLRLPFSEQTRTNPNDDQAERHRGKDRNETCSGTHGYLHRFRLGPTSYPLTIEFEPPPAPSQGRTSTPIGLIGVTFNRRSGHIGRLSPPIFGDTGRITSDRCSEVAGQREARDRRPLGRHGR